MKTNNRPMVKETQCEYVCSNLDCFPQFKFWKNKELKVERCSWCYSTHNQTGNIREVERQMNDTEYIQHLEECMEIAKEGLEGMKKLLKSYKDKEENCHICKNVSDENKELKEQIKAISIGGIGNHRKQLLKDQFLKVVESVLNQHDYNNFERTTCYCGWNSFIVFGEIQPFIQHLLQEIKSAMEKGNSNECIE